MDSTTPVGSLGGAIFNVVFLVALLAFAVYVAWKIYRWMRR